MRAVVSTRLCLKFERRSHGNADNAVIADTAGIGNEDTAMLKAKGWLVVEAKISLAASVVGDVGDDGDLSSVALAKEDDIFKQCPSDLQLLSRFSE